MAKTICRLWSSSRCRVSLFYLEEAERIGIKGTVRYCVDGSVEIVAEGNDDQLQDFL